MIKEINSITRPSRRLDLEDIRLLGECIAIGLESLDEEYRGAENATERRNIMGSITRLRTMQKHLREGFNRKIAILPDINELL